LVINYYYILKNYIIIITHAGVVVSLPLPPLLFIKSDSFCVFVSSVGVGAGGRGLLLPVVIFECDLKNQI